MSRWTLKAPARPWCPRCQNHVRQKLVQISGAVEVD
jgi:uncharacterized OB-fold protein